LQKKVFLPLSRSDEREKNLFLQAGHVEWEQPAIFDDLAGDLVFTSCEFAEWDFFASPDLVNQTEIRGGKHAQILAVLLVDALDVFGNRHFDARAQLGIRR